MKAGSDYLLTWLTIERAAGVPFAAALSFLFFSDAHGLPKTGFYVLAMTIVGIATIGYVVAVTTLLSWRESS